jgi:hypothetical protein
MVRCSWDGKPEPLVPNLHPKELVYPDTDRSIPPYHGLGKIKLSPNAF